MALAGLYEGVAPVRDSAPTRVRSSSLSRAEVRHLIEKTATETATNERPRPLDFTRAVPDEEEELSFVDLPIVRRASNRAHPHQPILWVDGPVDLALTVHALFRRDHGLVMLNPEQPSWLKSAWGRERWELARARVAEFPSQLTHESPGKYGVRTLADGAIGRFYEGKINQAQAGLWTNLRERVTTSVADGRQLPQLAPLTRRLNVLSDVQGLLGNQAALYGSTRSGGNPYGIVERELGAQRADTLGALSLLASTLERQARLRNRTWSNNLHEVFNYNRGEAVAYLAFLHQLLRRTSYGDNWVDENAETTWRLAQKVTAHVSLSTFDILARGPIDVNVERVNPAATLEELENTPTVRWADGTVINLFDGTEMTPALVANVRADPAHLLTVRNVEQRRALLRMVGHAALLEAVRSELVHEDEFGQLHRLPNGSQFVIVKNATPEPDGSVRSYVLGARGQNHQTARAAVASTWGLTEQQYWPIKET